MDIKLYNNHIKQAYNQIKGYSNQYLQYLLEDNHQKIIRLVPNLQHLNNNIVAKCEQYPNLYLYIDKKSTYTLFCTLSHKFHSNNTIIKKPDIKIKVYFDAQLTEAISICNDSMVNSKHPYIKKCSDFDLQWDLNILLSRWLDYCLNKQYKWQDT